MMPPSIRPARPPFRRRMFVRDVITTIAGFLIGLGAFLYLFEGFHPGALALAMVGAFIVTWNWR